MPDFRSSSSARIVPALRCNFHKSQEDSKVIVGVTELEQRFYRGNVGEETLMRIKASEWEKKQRLLKARRPNLREK